MVIKRIETIKELHEIYKLCYEEYIEKGFCQFNPYSIHIHYPHLDPLPQSTHFVVIGDDGEFLGCNSLTLDSEHGLHVDEDFPEEVDETRQYCKEHSLVLASSWRIVTKHETSHSSRVFKMLVIATIQEGLDKKVDICLFSFNPNQERSYQDLLNLETIAHGLCKGANNAPAVLMKGEREKILNSKLWARR